jgi:hypothetical protein
MKYWRHAPPHRAARRCRRCATAVVVALITGGDHLSGMALAAITIDTLRTAFAQHAETHEARHLIRMPRLLWLSLRYRLRRGGRVADRAVVVDGAPRSPFARSERPIGMSRHSTRPGRK